MIWLAHWLLLSVANVSDRVADLGRLRIAAVAAALAILVVAAAHSLGAASAAPTGESGGFSDRQTLAIAPQGESLEAPATNHSTAPGQLFAQVRALPRGSEGGAWRIEFGFLTSSILSAASGGRGAAVEANERLLPSSRFLNEAKLRSRERTNNRRWFASSLVRIGISGGGSVQGRVIARWNPKPGGAFRVEFGWLPEQARQAAGGNTQAAIAANGAVLPNGRYLNLATIVARAAQSSPTWLFSTSIDVPVTGGSGGGGMTDGETTPVISWRGYPSEGASVGATLMPLSAPTATVDGRPVQLRYRYGAVPSSVCGVDQSGRLELRTAGECRVTVMSVAGTYTSASKAVAVRVTTGPGHSMPVINWRGYPTEGANVGQTLMPLSAPTATVDGRPVQLRYRYGAVPSSVCGVDQSGRLELRTAGECRVTVTSAVGTYASASKTVMVQVVARQTPEIMWSGYPTDGASVGATLSPVSAPTATVDGRPVQLRYRYSAAPTSVCGVDQSGRLQLRAAGECRVTVTSAAGTYASARKMVTVRLAPKPVITWRGYPSDGASVGATLMPLGAPTATVDGRPVQLQYRYGAVPTSVCGVDQTGRLSLRTAGECRVTAMSVPGAHASASKTVMVQVVPQQKPEITWRGYPTEGASVGQTLMPLSAPMATVAGRPVQLQYRYNAEPTTVCGVGAGGRLQLRAAGECRVTATSVAGTYASASKAVTVQVVSQPPVITWRGYPTQGASVGATLMPLSAPTATVAGRPVSLRYSYSAEPTTICGVGAGGQLQLRAAGNCRVTATSIAGTYASASTSVTVQVVQPQPVIRWQGYPSNDASVGRTLSPLSAPTATVAGSPAQLQYRYSATPSSICRVNSSGTLTLLARGTCRVTATSVAGTYAPASAPAVTVSITPSGPATPPRSSFAYCGGDTIKVWYFNRSASTRHHLDITWQQANATFVVSWWGTIGTMSALDCGTWPAGRDYGLSDAERIADLLGIRAPKARTTPPASGFAYCGDDTIRVYYFERSAGTRHHLNITWQEANATFGGSWWNTIGNMSASDCGTWPLGRVYGLSDAQRIAGLPPTPTGGGGQPPVVPPTGGGGSGGGTQQPPLPLPEPPASRFVRCDGDTIRVWYFESSAKHHLNITGDQATAIFGGAWWGRIGSMSASDCARWPTGRVYGESDARRIAR